MYLAMVLLVTANKLDCQYNYQAHRQGGGFEGVRANPSFDLQKILYTPLNCTF